MTLRAADLNRTYTNAEFESMAEFAQPGYELIEGKVIYSMTGDQHGVIIRKLVVALAMFDLDEKVGTVWTQTNFNMGAGWIPAPDVAYVIASRRPVLSEKSIKVVPDLVVEVWSPGDLDSKPGRNAARFKIRKYQEVGVQLIWAINPRTQTIEIYHKESELPVKVLTSSDVLEGGEIIPGFSLPVAKLFE